MSQNILREAPLQHIFTADTSCAKAPQILPNVPINGYNGFLRPADNKNACALGDRCVREWTENIITDFERTESYCAVHGENDPDLMVHVSTFIILNGMIYMTYYASTGSGAEDPHYQEARLAFCPLNDPQNMTIVTLQKVGDILDGKVITSLYDTILLYKGGNELYLMWTAAPDGNYHRLYCTFNTATNTLGPVQANRFCVGNVTNDFSITGMQAALACNNIAHKPMWSDIGIMQKLSAREENGKIYYYTGAYSGNFNCIVKSCDFITWEYVAAPSFANNSKWENATYVLNDKCYYFVRQQECEQGFLTCYDLISETWSTPTLIADAQSRSDFIYYNNALYLIHAPINREGIGLVKIDTEDLSHSTVVFVADLKDSCFYPFVRLYGDEAYISYTVDRKHIRLAKFDLRNYV